MEMNEQEWNDILSSGKDAKGMINDVFSREKTKEDEEEEMNEIIIKEIMRKEIEERRKKREMVLQMPRPTKEEREASILNVPLDKDEQKRNDSLFQESAVFIFGK